MEKQQERVEPSSAIDLERASEEWKKTREAMATASQRIRRKLDELKGESQYLDLAYQISNSRAAGHLRVRFSPPYAVGMDWLPLFITDRPREIYPHFSWYHVTSALAVNNLVNNLSEGGKLYPPFLHRELEITTHRGQGLNALSRLLIVGGLVPWYKDQFVWFGSRIDPEQVVIEEGIAQLGPEIDRRVIRLFCEEENSKRWPLRAREKLTAWLDAVSVPGFDIEAPVSKKIKTEIDAFLAEVSFLTGIRGFWFQELKRIFYGQADFERIRKLRQAIGRFDWVFNPEIEPPLPSHVAIIEIDRDRLLRQIAVRSTLLVPVSDRSPEHFLAAPYVPAEAVKRVYVWNESHLSRRARDLFNVETISSLPEERFLAGVRPKAIKEIDPENPRCLLRYQKPPQAVWREHLVRARIAPLYWDSEYSVPEMFKILTEAFGAEIIGLSKEEARKVNESFWYQLSRRVLGPGQREEFSTSNLLGIPALYTLKVEGP